MMLGPMGLCYLTWFAALQRLPAATAAMGTLVVPVIGVIAAAILLDEPLGLREILAAALTLARRAGDPAVSEATRRPTQDGRPRHLTGVIFRPRLRKSRPWPSRRTMLRSYRAVRTDAVPVARLRVGNLGVLLVWRRPGSASFRWTASISSFICCW